MSQVIAPFIVTDAAGRDVLAECAFATVHDLKAIASWSREVRPVKNLITQDALEFAILASKRWRFYHEQRRTAASITAMKHKISSRQNTELAVLCIARVASIKSSVLGITLFRRTWCNHLVLEFLATHPVCLEKGPRSIAGVGKGLLYGVAEIANAIGAKVLWGEATETSAPIYQHIFQLKKVDDLLHVPAAKLRDFRSVMRVRTERSGLHFQ